MSHRSRRISGIEAESVLELSQVEEMSCVPLWMNNVSQMELEQGCEAFVKP